MIYKRYVLDAQHAHMGNVLPMYSELAHNGQIELTTTPTITHLRHC